MDTKLATSYEPLLAARRKPKLVNGLRLWKIGLDKHRQKKRCGATLSDQSLNLKEEPEMAATTRDCNVVPSSVPVAPIEINYWSEDDTIVVTPDDLDRFDIQKEVAIDVLRIAAKKEKVFHKQMSLLLRRLAGWVDAHKTKVTRGFLTLQDSSMAFVVVKAQPQIDDALEDSLSEMDVAIANDPDFNLLCLNTIALPPASPEALMSFLDERFLVSYDGKRNRPRRSGKQKP